MDITGTKRKFLLFALLTLATLFSDRFIDQYQDVGQQLLADADLSTGLSSWHPSGSADAAVTITDKEISLRAPDTNANVRIHQKITVPMSSKMVQLRALVRTKKVVAGEKSWHRARLLLVQYVDGKARWHLPHQVIALEGTNDWQEVSNVFTIASDCNEFRVVVQMSNCSGQFFLKGLRLYEAEETALYGRVKWLIRGAWILFILFVFVPYRINGNVTVSTLPVCITVVVLLVGTTMPGSVKDDLKGRIEVLAGAVSEIHITPSPAMDGSSSPGWLRSAVKEIDYTKVAHFVLFALLVVLIRYKNPDRPVKSLFLDIVMLACATELSQLFIENRSPLFTDVLIDMAGGGVGLLLYEGRRISRPVMLNLSGS